MRTYIYYCVLLIFSLLISGCRKKASISPVLQEAESLLPTDPDSVYCLPRLRIRVTERIFRIL